MAVVDVLQQYNERVEKSVADMDGESLRDLLSMRSTLGNDAMEVYVLEGGSLPRAMPEPWSTLPELVQNRFAAASALNASNWVEACAYLSQAVTVYLNILASDNAWSLPLLQSLATDLRLIAEQADAQLREEGLKASKLVEVERVLKRAFTTTNNDRRDIDEMSRRIGTLGVINHLLKVYFKLNNLRLCNNVTRAVTAPNFPDFESTFPVAHRVTYMYFSGRLHLYDDRCEEAVRDLTYAFERTPARYEKNKRLQLLYLIPAKILMGSLPSDNLLYKYNMTWFQDIATAIRTGNLRLFDDAVERHEEFFIKKALYLAIEKMRPLVYRSLCKRVFHVMESNKIKIDAFRISLNVCGVDMTRDEVECILANLIYNNYIKGYLAHKVGYVVLSKKNPFPKLDGLRM